MTVSVHAIAAIETVISAEDLMPNDIEIGFYELGIRTAQCEILHAFAVEEGISDDNHADVATSIECLRTAFDSIVKQVRSPNMSIATAARQIDRCRDLWQNCRDSNSSPKCQAPNQRIVGCLKKLRVFVDEIAELKSDQNTNALDWFYTGRTVCTLVVDLPAKPISVSTPDKMPISQSQPADVDQLLKTLRVDPLLILPEPSSVGVDPRFPYPHDRFATWIQIEKGLRSLQKTVPTNIQGLNQQTAAAARSGRGHLGLRFDTKNWTVHRQGRSGKVEFRDSRLHWGILGALDDNGDAPLSIDGLKRVWKIFAQDDNPEVRTVYDALSKVRGKIKPLGLGIRNHRGVGWLLIELAPPLT